MRKEKLGKINEENFRSIILGKFIFPVFSSLESLKNIKFHVEFEVVQLDGKVHLTIQGFKGFSETCFNLYF
jgi:hypothetical protein